MKKIPHRVVIYPKDIENITGRMPRTCRTIFQKMRVYFKKNKGEFITYREFSQFSGISEDLIKEFLSD